MDRTAIRDLIERGYTARKDGDVEAIVDGFHPDGVFQLLGSASETKIVNSANGHEGIRATMAGLVGAFEFLEQTFVSFLIDGNKAAVHARTTVRFIPNGKVVTTDILDLWTIENGKTVELIEFADTALINQLAAA